MQKAIFLKAKSKASSKAIFLVLKIFAVPSLVFIFQPEARLFSIYLY